MPYFVSSSSSMTLSPAKVGQDLGGSLNWSAPKKLSTLSEFALRGSVR